jgi:hypothetical protein
MSDVWYYAEGNRPIGPFTLGQLILVLSSFSEAENILVWRDGFSNWIEAANVAPIAAHLTPEKTALLANLPSVPVGGRGTAEATFPGPKRRSRNLTASIVSMILIALAIGGVRYITYSNLPKSSFDYNSAISGKARDSFVSEGINSCISKQENDPDNKSLSLSRDVLSKYCSCYMNALADITIYADLRDVSTPSSIGPAFRKKIAAADASCTDKLRRSLLGGG